MLIAMPTDVLPPRTLIGRIFGIAGRAEVAGVTAWFAYRTVDGETQTYTTVTDADGTFVFDLPDQPVASAAVGAHLEGVEPVDLGANSHVLEPGDVVLVANDIVPSHLRHAG